MAGYRPMILADLAGWSSRSQVS